MFNLVLVSLFFISLFCGFYMILRKIPALVDISLESIQNKETFIAFIKRIIKVSLSFIHPRKIKIYFLVIAEKILARFKTTTLKVHKTVDVMSKDLKQKSQQEKWEHNWFSHKDKDDDK